MEWVRRESLALSLVGKGHRVIFRSIDGPAEVEHLVSRSQRREVSARWVAGLLERGESRPEWCRLAESPDGELLAAHALDSFSMESAPGPVPTFVTLLGHVDDDAAVALLRNDLDGFGVESVEARVTAYGDVSPSLAALRRAQVDVLTAAGFALLVDRVQLEWQSTSPVPRPSGALDFRPASTFPSQELVEIFAGVGDGSVDNGMVSGRSTLGREGEAERRLRYAEHRRHEDAWFVVGVDSSGEPVGFVQSALVDGDRPILAEIGVIERYRGRRYVDDLLAYGTGVLAVHGATSISSTTDVANRGMRGAFARAGYAEAGSRRDFGWRRGVGGVC